MNMKAFIAAAFTLSCILTVGVEGVDPPKRQCPEVEPKPAFPEFGQPNFSPIDTLPQAAKSCLQNYKLGDREYSDVSKAFSEFFIKLMDFNNFISFQTHLALSCLNVVRKKACLQSKMPQDKLPMTRAFIELSNKILKVTNNNWNRRSLLLSCMGKKNQVQKSRYQILHKMPNATECALKLLGSSEVLRLDRRRFHYKIELASFVAKYGKEILPLLHCLECRLMDKAADFNVNFFSTKETACIKNIATAGGFDVLKDIVLRFSKFLKNISKNNVKKSKDLVKCIR